MTVSLNLDLSKHYSMQITQDVKTICQDLFEQFNIDAFFYSRIYYDGQSFLLTTHPEWYQHHMSKQYKAVPFVPEAYIEHKFYYYLSQTTEYQEVLHDIRTLFNLDHLFYIFELKSNFFDVYCFSSNPSNHDAINFYLNKRDILNNFIFSFKEKAEHLIEQSNSNLIVLPESMRPDAQLFSEKTNLSKAKHDFDFYHFSRREKDCLKFILKGRTIKETAKYLNLSNRTVEYYFNNIKAKLHCHSKSQVIDFIEKFKIYDILNESEF